MEWLKAIAPIGERWKEETERLTVSTDLRDQERMLIWRSSDRYGVARLWMCVVNAVIYQKPVGFMSHTGDVTGGRGSSDDTSSVLCSGPTEVYVGVCKEGQKEGRYNCPDRR